MQATDIYEKVKYLQDDLKIQEQTIQNLQEALKEKKEHANEARKECIIWQKHMEQILNYVLCEYCKEEMHELYVNGDRLS